MHVTIVDDIKENLDLYDDLLNTTFDLQLIQNPVDLISFLEKNQTDLILLDLHMPGMDGFELYSKFKNINPNLPVIFLSGDPSEESIVRGLSLGAEDFIVKPVSLKELVARIKNKIIRSKNKAKENNVIRIHNFALFIELQQAEIDGKKIQLTPIEFKLIQLFMKNTNKIFSRDYISKLLWPDVHVQNQNIDTHLSNLRKKLKPFSQHIKTIKSRGYILRV